MPQHNPEDRVRVRNIVAPEADDIQTLWITRYRKDRQIDANGQQVTKEFPYEKEIEWNFKDGFLFFWGGKAYVLKRGEERTYSRFLAEHCAKHMVDYVLNKKYLTTKRMGDDGTPRYDQNILNNEILKKKIRSEIIVGVEEWFEGQDDDFDTMLANKFGGDAESLMTEKVNKEDFQLPEEEQDEVIKNIPSKEPIKPTTDSELQKMRDEADALALEYSQTDTAETIKKMIVKEMA